MSESDWSENVHVPQSAQWESGDIQKHMDKLAEVLGVPVEFVDPVNAAKFVRRSTLCSENKRRRPKAGRRFFDQERSYYIKRLRRSASEISELKDQLAKALDYAERARRDRYDALGVKTKEGLLASEWLLRTGKAERERDEALAEVARLRGEVAKLTKELFSFQFPTT